MWEGSWVLSPLPCFFLLIFSRSSYFWAGIAEFQCGMGFWSIWIFLFLSMSWIDHNERSDYCMLIFWSFRPSTWFICTQRLLPLTPPKWRYGEKAGEGPCVGAGSAVISEAGASRRPGFSWPRFPSVLGRFIFDMAWRAWRVIFFALHTAPSLRLPKSLLLFATVPPSLRFGPQTFAPNGWFVFSNCFSGCQCCCSSAPLPIPLCLLEAELQGVLKAILCSLSRQ